MNVYVNYNRTSNVLELTNFWFQRIEPLKGPTEDHLDLTQENQQEALKNVIAPLWTLPYSEQLDHKNEYVSYVIKRYYTLMLEGYNHPSRMKGPPRISKPHIMNIIPSVR